MRSIAAPHADMTSRLSAHTNSAPAAMDGSGGIRPFDVTVELRGTVGLSPPPDKNAIGGGSPAAGEGGA
jgi:hypothetical protein